MTHSEEDYLKAIYHLEKKQENAVNTNAIAEQINTKPSSVTDMIKKLSDKQLIDYQKYQGVFLTDLGRQIALSIVRKHRLWESFLVDKLAFSWDEVHEIAEQLEHIKSDMLIDRLDQFLGFPKYDPHGDPIPSKNGTFSKSTKIVLNEMSIKSRGLFVGVKDSSVSFLKFLDKQSISLGDEIQLLDKEDFDQSVCVQIHKRRIHLSHQIASNLFIEPIANL